MLTVGRREGGQGYEERGKRGGEGKKDKERRKEKGGEVRKGRKGRGGEVASTATAKSRRLPPRPKACAVDRRRPQAFDS